jgi:hypothetical protein
MKINVEIMCNATTLVIIHHLTHLKL